MKSNIDIVIPVYNRASLLPRTLESIERQTMRPDSVVLVDNNSTDSSLEVMTAWQRKMTELGWSVTVVSEAVPGASAARNRGLDCVTAEYVMFFDSDDVMLPSHVEDFARALAARPDADIAGRGVVQKMLGGKERRGIFTTVAPEFCNVFTGLMATLRYVARRSLIERAGRWDVTVMGWDDIELGMRLLALKPVVIKVAGPESVVVFSQEDSITGTSFSNNPGKWERSVAMMRNTALRHGRRDLLTWTEAKAMILAADYAREGDEANAARLRDEVIAASADPRRMKMIYGWHRRMRRFTWALTLCLFGTRLF